jgi:acyl-CoA thioester hydrolase
MNTDQYTFTLKMQVRDYELDYQGIVNNANYLHYLEHTRHEFCRQAGLTFAGMHERGIDPVLASVKIDYRHPLRSDETFISCLNIQRRGPKFIFQQDLYKEDGTPVLMAQVAVACVENGQLTRGEVLAELFKDYLQ